MIKVVHVLGKFDQGGVEMLLKEIFLNTDSEVIKFYFILLDDSIGYYETELLNNGAVLKKIPIKKGYRYFSKEFSEFIKNEKVDVVHSHVQIFSGYILRLASLAGVKCRISHSHSDERVLDLGSSIFRKGYLYLGYLFLKRYATLKIACSSEAGKSLYRGNDFKLLHNGINEKKFSPRNIAERSELMAGLGLDSDVTVVGHVGRLVEVKNHKFLLEIAKEVKKINIKVKWLFCGSGILADEIRGIIKDFELEDTVYLTGPRDDIPDLMSHVFDGFIMTSHYEGLPLVMVEAQFAGLSCLIPSHISKEVEVFPELINYASLNENAEFWAEKLIQIIPNTNATGFYLDKTKNSSFTLSFMIKELNKLYKI